MSAGTSAVFRVPAGARLHEGGRRKPPSIATAWPPPPIATRRVASRVVGWAMRPDGRAELGVDALEMAVWRRRHSALGYLSPEESERRWSVNPESIRVTLSTKAGESRSLMRRLL